MNFKVPFFRPSAILSDAGFSVTMQKDFLTYKSGNLSLDFYIEVGAGIVKIDSTSVGRINYSETSKALTDVELAMIYENIIDALKWRGWMVDLS